MVRVLIIRIVHKYEHLYDIFTPTLSRSFVVAPFRLGLVWLSVLSTLPPNPSACPRVSVWDKPWDKFANYFETASPQFHFCPGDKNGLVLRP